MERTLEQVREVLKQQPFSQLVDAEITHYSKEKVVFKIPIQDKVKQQFGFAHGGLIAFAADSALTFAGGIALGPKVLTSEFKINFMRPGIGEYLYAEGTVISAGKRQAVTQCKIYVEKDGQQKLCAIAQGTIAAMNI